MSDFINFKKILGFVFILLWLTDISSICAQKKENNEKDKKEKVKETRFWDRVIFGGNIGLQFGAITSINISPNIGYYVTPRLIAGLGLTYQYYNSNEYNYRFSSNIFGIRTFADYEIIKNIGQNLPIKSNFSIFTHVEYEALNLDRDLSNTLSSNKVKRFWLHGVLAGGGIRESIGKRSFLSIEILYNFIADSRTPYDNPVMRIGFFF